MLLIYTISCYLGCMVFFSGTRTYLQFHFIHWLSNECNNGVYLARAIVLSNFPFSFWTSSRFDFSKISSFTLFEQYETNGRIADSMLVNTILMLVYVTKFFWWEAGYWNTMDIAHDRGLRMFFSSSLLHCTLCLF